MLTYSVILCDIAYVYNGYMVGVMIGIVLIKSLSTPLISQKTLLAMSHEAVVVVMATAWLCCGHIYNSGNTVAIVE